MNKVGRNLREVINNRNRRSCLKEENYLSALLLAFADLMTNYVKKKAAMKITS